jgi:hypothetical protein
MFREAKQKPKNGGSTFSLGYVVLFIVAYSLAADMVTI